MEGDNKTNVIRQTQNSLISKIIPYVEVDINLEYDKGLKLSPNITMTENKRE